MKENEKQDYDIVINGAMQLIPYVGSSLATLYFGRKQEKRFKKLEQTIKELAQELQGIKLPSIKLHNQEELLSLVEQLNDKIENEYIEQKRLLYKNFYKKILISPNINNYDERKMFLDILEKLTPLQLELLTYLIQQTQPTVDISIEHPKYPQATILGSLAQLKNYGLIKGFVNSISIGGTGGIQENIVVSDFGRSFHNFCIL